MKTQVSKKLIFKKNSIAELNTERLNIIHGGGTTTPSIDPTVRQWTTAFCKISQNTYSNP